MTNTTSYTTKITEICDKSACAAWSPIASGLVALGAKVSISSVVFTRTE
jgi:hypothetical protein